ncbi:MAG TPA: phenylalanine--tRNA ligase subunit alpha [Candidatus Angelobacter sp.]|nr:phenylalanine--tRNA ligase subunit alpha [Candidatus Angelobacter sp.]
MAYTVPKLEDYSDESLQKSSNEVLSALDSEITTFVQEAPQLTPIERTNRKRIVHDTWLARKNGILTQINELWLKAAPPDKKRAVGSVVNKIGAHARVQLDELQKLQFLEKNTLRSEGLDITLPGIRRPLGAEHPVIKTMNEIVSVFRTMGYSVADGPEIETDYYNFESLNFPPNHPARDTQDTIFISGQEKKQQRDRLLLRTHTSPVQIHTMEKYPPPIRVVVPGKVHRADTADATHSPIFHQVEGLAVDTNITFCDLKGTLDHAMKALFGSSVKTRFYPSFFPFTEPSADVQITCFKCGGQGCRLCKMSGWIELLGCGMVDPNVFNFVESNGYDAEKVSGFAFGMGVERITMLKYGIDDIQLFYQGDVRFLEQFA